MREAGARAEAAAAAARALEEGTAEAAEGDEDGKPASRVASPEPAAAPFSWLSTVVFVAVIVSMLLLLYYFYQYFVWFIIATYCLAGTLAMYESAAAVLDATCSFGMTRVKWSLEEVWGLVTGGRRCWCRCTREHPRWRNLFLLALAGAFCACWVAFRRWPYAFILQDTISVFFCINLIKSLRMPSLKWVTILLLALLFYDLFMVFITPLFTGNGCSVMVEVATGSQYCREVGGGAVGAPPNAPLTPTVSEREQLPILILVPRLRDPMLPCYDLDVNPRFPATMLGLGDIILPGLLVGFCFAVDAIMGFKWPIYGLTCVLAYGAGIVATFVALMLSKMAQPALIYLVPFTLASTFILAIARKELSLLWTGELEQGKGEGESSDTALDVNTASNYQTINAD